MQYCFFLNYYYFFLENFNLPCWLEKQPEYHAYKYTYFSHDFYDPCPCVVKGLKEVYIWVYIWDHHTIDRNKIFYPLQMQFVNEIPNHQKFWNLKHKNNKKVEIIVQHDLNWYASPNYIYSGQKFYHNIGTFLIHHKEGEYWNFHLL